MRRFRAKTLVRIALTPLVVWGLYVLRANVWFRLYPAIMASIAFVAFAVSLFRTPLAEVVARRSGDRLGEHGVAYCRKVTWVWTVFLAAHLAVTVLTVFASHEVWAVYNGLVAYVLMGVLFVGEWLVRRRVRRD